jgi:hypothetical protein
MYNNEPLLPELWRLIRLDLSVTERARLRLVSKTLWSYDAAFVSPAWTHAHIDLPQLPTAGISLWREYCRQLCEVHWVVCAPDTITWKDEEREQLRLYWKRDAGPDVLLVSWNPFSRVDEPLSSFATRYTGIDERDPCYGSGTSFLRYIASELPSGLC